MKTQLHPLQNFISKNVFHSKLIRKQQSYEERHASYFVFNILLAIFLFVNVNLFSQSPNTSWKYSGEFDNPYLGLGSNGQVPGSSGEDWFYNIIGTTDGGSLGIGYAQMDVGGIRLYPALVKLNPNGTKNWIKGCTDDNSKGGVFWDAVELNGFYYAVGTKNDPSSNNQAGVLVKINPSGTIIFYKYFHIGNLPNFASWASTNNTTAIPTTGVKFEAISSYRDPSGTDKLVIAGEMYGSSGAQFVDRTMGALLVNIDEDGILNGSFGIGGYQIYLRNNDINYRTYASYVSKVVDHTTGNVSGFILSGSSLSIPVLFTSSTIHCTPPSSDPDCELKDRDIYLVKTDLSGNVIWDNTFNESSVSYTDNTSTQICTSCRNETTFQTAVQVEQKPGTDDFIVLGEFDYNSCFFGNAGCIGNTFLQPSVISTDAVLFGVNGSNGANSQSVYPTTLAEHFGGIDFIPRMLVMCDGRVLVAGNIQTAFSPTPALGTKLIMLPANGGTPLWSGIYTGYPGTLVKCNFGLAQALDGGFLLAGNNDLNDEDFDVVKTKGVQISGLSVICSGSSTTLDAGQGYSSYLWSPGGATTQTISTGAGIYSVTVHEAGGCVATTTFTVTENPNCCTQGAQLISSTGDLPPSNYSGTRSLSYNASINGTVTFDGLDLSIASGVSITVSAGSTLNVLNSHLHACINMWQGIINNGGTVNINGSSIIEDAIEALRLQNNGSALLSNSTFTNNHIDLVADNGNYSSSTIDGVTFNGASLTKAPYAGSKTYANIKLNVVGNIDIGSAGNNANHFQNARYGIYATSSNLNVKNSTFDNFISKCSSDGECETVGIAISARGNQSVVHSLHVGGSNAEACTFTNCSYGIYCFENMATNIIANSFLIEPATYPANAVKGTAIFSSMNSFADQTINENDFQNYASNINVRKTIEGNTYVRNNRFNVNFSTYHFDRVIENAITIENLSLSGTILHNAEVEGNLIYNCKRGILLTNMSGSLVKNNHVFPIFFNRTTTMSYGIKIKGGGENQIIDNAVAFMSVNPPAAVMEKIAMGITIESSFDNLVKNNSLVKMGTGIRFFNCSPPNEVSCNGLNNCISGITLEASDIGDQGTASDPSGNFWFRNPNRVADLQGIPMPLLTRDWYIESTSSEYIISTNPLSIVPFQTVRPIQVNERSNCSNSPCITPECKQEVLYRIAKEIDEFANQSEDQKYATQKFAFVKLTSQPELMNLGTDKDYDLQQFYDSLWMTNIGLLSDVAQQIIDYDSVSASITNSVITPENMKETNAKIVNYIYLETMNLVPVKYTEEQRNTLLNIAYQNPFSGGDAVYDARVMLELDTDDYYDIAYRLRSSSPERDTIPGKIIPNPNSGKMQFVYTLLENETGKLEIYDLKGNSIRDYSLTWSNNPIDIDLEGTTAGIYFFRFTVNGRIILSNKIVIAH